MIFLAHVGDYVGILYLAPLVIIVAVLLVQNIRDRRRGGDDAADGDPEGAADPADDFDGDEDESTSIDARGGP